MVIVANTLGTVAMTGHDARRAMLLIEAYSSPERFPERFPKDPIIPEILLNDFVRRALSSRSYE